MIDGPLFDLRWNQNLDRDAEGAPLLPPQFVLGLDASVPLVDLRSPEEATGVVGYIPGSLRLDPKELNSFQRDQPIVLVSRLGEDAAALARRLESEGWSRVAALDGGMAAWRGSGFGTSRDPAGLSDGIRPAEQAGSGPLTVERIREHVGDPRAVRWVKMVSLIGQSLCSCIDGRDGRGVIGTPGGDAGEFVLFLAALEQANGISFDRAAVRDALLHRLDTFGGLYLHTDEQAMGALATNLRSRPDIEPIVAAFDAPEQWFELLERPPEAVRESLLDHLADPSHVGCGHLRLMLQHPDEYGLRAELVADTIRTFFRLRWEGATELHLTALPGGHRERAVLNVRLSDEVWNLSRVPLVSPSCGGEQMFVNHPDAVGGLRRELARLAGGGSDLVRTIEELASRQLTATLGHLAGGLPIFEVAFAQDGTYEVREAS